MKRLNKSDDLMMSKSNENKTSKSKIVDEIRTVLDKSNYQIKIDFQNLERLESKKHYVYGLNGFVFKYFNRSIENWGQLYQNEVETYISLANSLPKKFHLPKLYFKNRGLIIYGFINSETYLDRLLNETLGEEEIDLLASIFVELHKKNMYYMDPRLRNFLFSENGDFYLIDLEEIQESQEKHYRDISSLLSSFLDISPNIFDILSGNRMYLKNINEDYKKNNKDNQTSLSSVLKFRLNCVATWIIKYTENFLLDYSIKDSTNKDNRNLLKTEFWTSLIIKGLKQTSERRHKKIDSKIWRKIEKTLQYFLKKNINN